MTQTDPRDAPARQRPGLMLKLGFSVIVGALLLMGLEWGARRVYLASGAGRPIPLPPADPYGGAVWRPGHQAALALYNARYLPGPTIRFFPYAQWVMRPMESPTLNITADGVRASLSGARQGLPPYRIYLFGGSTLLSLDVPDEKTIPSLLGQALNASPLGATWAFEVVNFGASGFSSTQEIARLFHEFQRNFATHGTPRLVVFYDGVNEVWAGVHLGHPGLFDAYERMALRFDDLPAFLKLKAFEGLSARSCLVKLLEARAAPVPPALDPGALERLSVEQATIYEKNIQIARGLGASAGFDTLHVLQPVVFVHQDRDPYNQAMKSGLSAREPRLALANRIGYEKLRALFAGNPRAVDLSGALDGIGEPVYTDYCHVSHRGNERVAARLALLIQERIRANRGAGP